MPWRRRANDEQDLYEQNSKAFSYILLFHTHISQTAFVGCYRLYGGEDGKDKLQKKTNTYVEGASSAAFRGKIWGARAMAKAEGSKELGA